MRRFLSYGPSILVLLTVMVVFLVGPVLIRTMQVAQMRANVTLAQHTLDSSSILVQINAANRAVAEVALPSVVHVEARGQARGGDDEEGERFRRAPTSGAGWIYDDEGYVITNAHVVQNADRARVELYDGRVRNARVVGTDRQTDIAVLKLDPGASGVISFNRATRESLHMGERVYAFGSPFGIKFSMTEGIVSGLGRTSAAHLVGLREGYTNFIQTDAAINPGNSGGPLVDVHGRVVGMNTAIANNMSDITTTQGQSAGIGFAIPVETIESVAEQLIESGVVIRGYLGINIGFDLSPEEAEEIGFNDTGVLVTGVPSDQPAAKSGLRRDDIIISVAGQPTPHRDVLRSIVSVQRPGEPVEIRYWRDGRVRDTQVRLGGAYNVGFRLNYIPGSEEMSLDEIREIVD